MQFADISVVANPGYPTFPLAPGGGATTVPQGGSIANFQSFGPSPPYVTPSEAQYFDSDINVAHAPGIVSVCVNRDDNDKKVAHFPRGSVVTIEQVNPTHGAGNKRRHPIKELEHAAFISCGCKKEGMYVKKPQDHKIIPLGVLAEAVRFEKGETSKVVAIAVKGAADVVIDSVEDDPAGFKHTPLDFIPGRMYYIGKNGLMKNPRTVYASACKVLIAPGASDKVVNVYLL